MEVKNLTFSYGETIILDDISFEITKGKITTIIGANGCGKTTLFNLLTKNLTPNSGEIYLNKKNIKNIKLKEFAKNVSIVHQQNTVPGDLEIEKLVGYGRIPHSHICKSLCGIISEEDQIIIDKAMNLTDVYKIKDRAMAKLSGGQRQRAFIAMALAQDTDILFLDEPTTYLDIKYQIEILEIIKKLNKEHGITVIMVLHDINQAIKYSDEIIGLKSGRLAFKGKPYDVIQKESIKEVFDIDVDIIDLEEKKIVIF